MGNLKLEVHENATLKFAMQGPALKIAAGKTVVTNPKIEKHSRILNRIKNRGLQEPYTNVSFSFEPCRHYFVTGSEQKKR